MPRTSTAASAASRVWARDTNDARQLSEQTPSVAAALAAYAPTHNFRRDVLAYCKVVGVTPHPKLVPMHPDEEESQGAESSTSSGGGSSANANLYDVTDVESVAVKNWQLDRGNCRALCFALPLCAKIHSLCLFSVMLDREQLELVCQTVPTTQIQALQLEWNASDATSKRGDRGGASPRPAGPVDEQAPASDATQGKSADGADSDSGEDDCSAVFAQLLCPPSALVFLSLRSNGITSSGAVALANALRSNTTLQSLNLFQNCICDDGALALAHALPHNAALKSLSVANNAISGKGAAALIGAITRYEAPSALLKEIEDAESKIQAEIDHAKKAKKKIDRHTAMQNLGLPLLEVIDGVQYAPGNAVLEELVLSGNTAITDADAVALGDALDAFAPKLESHLRHVKLQRIPALRALHQRSPKLSDWIVL